MKKIKFTQNGYFSIYQLDQSYYNGILKSLNNIKNLKDKIQTISISIYSEIPITFELDGIEIKNTNF